MKTYSPGTSPLRYSGISERSKRPSGKKILRSGPYHLASSSSMDEDAAVLALVGAGAGAAFFLPNKATIFEVPALCVAAVGAGAGAAFLKLSWFPNNSDLPKQAAAVEAATEAMSTTD